MEEENLDSDDGNILSILSNLEHLIDSWILNLVYFYHMIGNKDWFDTYRSVNFNFVLMDNNASYKVIGIGNIITKIFNGVVRTLCDVRHVPNLKKKLISLGTLDCNGCNYKSINGAMKVSKGVVTMMKG